MTTISMNIDQENTKKTLFINYANTKRLQWSRYRRYGF